MSEPSDDPATYGLIVSFTDKSASFTHGFEAGQIWGAMNYNNVAELELVTHSVNREVIARMCDAEGWEIEEMVPSDVDGWDFTKLRKTKAARVKPNPHGLRIVSA